MLLGRFPDTSVEKARRNLDRRIKRFREGWPYLSPEEVAAIRARGAEEYRTLEDCVRELATPVQP